MNKKIFYHAHTSVCRPENFFVPNTKPARVPPSGTGTRGHGSVIDEKGFGSDDNSSSTYTFVPARCIGSGLSKSFRAFLNALPKSPGHMSPKHLLSASNNRDLPFPAVAVFIGQRCL